MNRRSLSVAGLLVVIGALASSACGGGGNTSAPSTNPAASPPPPAPGSPAPSQGPSALTPETEQSPAGDIPDNQVFLTYRDAASGYSIDYPEGWARQGSGKRVTFRDKNNLVRIEIANGAGVTIAGASEQLQKLRRLTPSLRFTSPTRVTASGQPVVKVVYSTRSAANPVTGKRVTLVVDRYYVPGAGRHAVVDLGTPEGVDNVDAYRLMIESFKWK
jgi:PsbP